VNYTVVKFVLWEVSNRLWGYWGFRPEFCTAKINPHRM